MQITGDLVLSNSPILSVFLLKVKFVSHYIMSLHDFGISFILAVFRELESQMSVYESSKRLKTANNRCGSTGGSRRWTERELNWQPTDCRMNSYHHHHQILMLANFIRQ